MSIQGNIIRVEIDTAFPYKTPANKISGTRIDLPRSRDIIFQIGVRERGIWQANPDYISQVTVELKSARTASPTCAASSTGLSLCQESEWDDDTSQHFSVPIPAGQTAGLPTADETTYWLAITAALSSGATATLLAGVAYAVNDGGNYSATVPDPGDPNYATLAQMFAAIGAANAAAWTANGYKIVPSVDENGLVTFNAIPA